MRKETKSAKSAKANATKHVNNVVSVEVNDTNVAALTDATESEKVSSKEVLKAASTIRAAIKEERRGANVTIRLIAERAAAGDSDAANILCALCDVPKNSLFTLNIDTVRAAVNAWYPYYTEVENRRVSVKPVGVWYTTANGNEEIEDASQRVQRGYRVVTVVDYLDMLIKAAKSRAKGITPRCVDSNAIYTDCKMSTAADGITSAEIDEAKERRTYSDAAANVWRRDRNGFYI